MQGYSPSGVPLDSEVSGVYVARIDGTGRKLLAASAGAPAWSPDGGSLVYMRALHIYHLDLATGTEAQLTSGDNWNRYPVWSPDGKRIAFDSNKGIPSGLSHLVVSDPDGSNMTRITASSDSARGERPTFSPDGETLAYEKAVRDSVDDRIGTEIFLIDTTGQNMRRLPHGEMPAWGPSNDWIAFMSDDLRLVHPDGTGEQVIYAGGVAGIPFGHPAWSTDGKWIAFSAVDAHDSVAALWAIHPDGTGIHQLTFPSNGNTSEKRWLAR